MSCVIYFKIIYKCYIGWEIPKLLISCMLKVEPVVECNDKHKRELEQILTAQMQE